MSDEHRERLDRLYSVLRFNRILTTAERGFDKDLYGWTRERRIACYPVGGITPKGTMTLVADMPGSLEDIDPVVLETMAQTMQYKGDVVIFNESPHTEGKIHNLIRLCYIYGLRILWHGDDEFFARDIREPLAREILIATKQYQPVWTT